MDKAKTETRAKRFYRSAAPKPMQLTKRDLTLLANIARHRFLSAAHLTALDGGSSQGVSRCLRALFDHGYLDRPRAQLAKMPADGPRPFIYGLGKMGVRALREQGHLIDGGVDWTEKNKRAGSKYIEHTLAISDFMTSIELACRSDTNIELISEHEIIALTPDKTQKAREPLRWQADILQNGSRETASVVPDGLFGLRFADDTAAYFLLEIDRGTISIRRSIDDHRSIVCKLATYYEGWKANRHVEQFGVKQVRVLTVTNSRERVRNMLTAVDEVTGGKGSNFFLFIDKDSLASAGPFKAEWRSGKEQDVRLID